jgi:lactate dehydrogenase-like 2-hydroxyacid dehydrogenase
MSGCRATIIEYPDKNLQCNLNVQGFLMKRVILYPDVQFDGAAIIEQGVFDSAYELRIDRGGNLNCFSNEDFTRAEALVCYHEISVDAAVLDRLPRCRVVVRAGVGFDNIDLCAAGSRGIAVCNTPDYGTTDVADHAIALTLALTRGVVTYNNKIRLDPALGWDFRHGATVRRSSTLVFGVVGLGRIGTATALRAKALGMRVIFHDPSLPTGTELALAIERATSLSDLLAVSDVVSLHMPLNDSSRDLFTAPVFAQMKTGAFLVNTARGGVVDLGALQDALTSKKLAGAAIDVAQVEPLVATHPLMAAWLSDEKGLQSKLIITPHAAFYSPSSLDDLRRKSAETALNFLKTGLSPDLVNGHSLDRSAQIKRLEDDMRTQAL